jgi:AraC-like DNA-binding protein
MSGGKPGRPRGPVFTTEMATRAYFLLRNDRFELDRDGLPEDKDVAKELGMSVRTLERRYAERGTTFSKARPAMERSFQDQHERGRREVPRAQLDLAQQLHDHVDPAEASRPRLPHNISDKQIDQAIERLELENARYQRAMLRNDQEIAKLRRMRDKQRR